MHRWEGHTGLAIAAAATALLAGCPRDSETTPKRRSSTTVRVRSFTEATPVTSVSAVMPYAFAGTDRGLDRWDLRSGQRLMLTADHGLPGDRVLATALDAGRGWLWVATDGGVTRYEIDSGVFTGVPPAPTDKLAALAQGARAMAAAGTGGVWIGGPEGLAYAEAGGDWKLADIDHPVTALLRDTSGNLWIGTDGGGVLRQGVDGTVATFADAAHQAVARVRFIVEAPDGTPLIVGENAEGAQRVSFFREGMFASFRVSPDDPWIAGVRRGEETVVMTRRRLYAIGTGRKGARRLRREGMRLIALAAGSDTARGRSPYHIRTLDAPVPTGATALACVADDELLIGTEDLGTALFRPGARRVHWLRRGELGGAGEDVSVACASKTECFIATGGQGVWRFDGTAFQSIGDEETSVLAVVRARSGEVYALYRIGDEGRIRVARLDSGEWQPNDDIEVRTPGTRASLSFAKFSPSGRLWIGLRYRDDTDQELSYGAAEIDIGLVVVAYHRASRDESDVEKGVLPIPISVTDIDFLGEKEVWLGSREGVTQIQGQEIRVYMESEGLVSELVRSIAVTSGGVVFAATGVGVGVFDGESWSAPAPLQRAVNAVAVGPDGKLWMATPRGVAAYDGARVRRLDSRRGLLEDDIADIEIDSYGRIWALSASGLSIIVP